VLLIVSLATAGAGAYILSERLGAMTTTLTAGTATTVDVYVGQSVAVAGAIVLGAGIIGVLLALTIAALSTLRPRVADPIEVAETAAAADATPTDDAEPTAEADTSRHGYERGLGYTEAVDTVRADDDAVVPTR
jgi:threonine dehydrogenase-like Zn-dependent dehydrogenase